jgi:hypothetical protein
LVLLLHLKTFLDTTLQGRDDYCSLTQSLFPRTLSIAQNLKQKAPFWKTPLLQPSKKPSRLPKRRFFLNLDVGQRSKNETVTVKIFLEQLLFSY